MTLWTALRFELWTLDQLPAITGIAGTSDDHGGDDGDDDNDHGADDGDDVDACGWCCLCRTDPQSFALMVMEFREKPLVTLSFDHTYHITLSHELLV